MKTGTIQENLPEVYEKLFSECSLVVSAPGDFFWSGEHAADFGGIGISQHLPVRIYIGLKPNNISAFRLVDFKEFTASKFKFFSINFKEFNFTEFFSHINTIKKAKQGYDVYIVSEIPVSCGLNSLGALSAAFSLLFYIVEGKVDKNEIDSWSGTRASKIISDADFNLVFRLAWKLNAILHSGYCPPIRAFVPFVWSEFPVFCASEKIAKKENFIEKIDTLNYFAGSMDELSNSKNMIHWPVDIALIYSGEIKPHHLLLESVKEVKNRHHMIAQDVKESLKKMNDFKKYVFWDKISDQADLWTTHVNSLATTSIEVFYCLKKMFERETENIIHDLLLVIRGYNDGLKIMSLTSNWTREIMAFLVDYSWRKGSATAGVKLTGAGRGGDVLFVVPAYDFRDSMDDILDHIRKLDETKTIFLDYASWIDGFENRGIMLEQDIENKVISNWISCDCFKVTHLKKDGTSETSVMASKEIDELKHKAQIVLDRAEKKIYINGKKMTSDELLSSSTTIDFFEILIEKVGKSISNKNLNFSSYARDRNEFQGKILHPFQKIVKELTDKNINIELHGAITDFHFRLLPGTEIYFIHKTC